MFDSIKFAGDLVIQVIGTGLCVIGVASIIYKVVPTPKEDEELNTFQRAAHYVLRVVGKVALNKN
jgi:hypothetical protein